MSDSQFLSYHAMTKMDDGYMPVASALLTTDTVKILIAANRYGLTHLTFKPKQGDNWPEREIQLAEGTQTDMVQAEQHLAQAQQQLTEYFSGQLKQFNLALAPVGTPFQHQVWQALIKQPFGHACSYSDIATAINNPKAVRAVGSANGANDIAIIIPCHRIIGKSGTLTGYAYGLELKQLLLTLESAAS
ncbi:methylated-DNA--[protein]-cysteine S-methyltransferase [Shewanella sp. Isolate11]|uniref:methylated-DNA--[protein]-cysteine S-methyltransferase n=1 Tax=Shewanella sp. Isolate11 TaxID=2908530 RepID=UPI001EFCA8FA|nr:methylated-DNA--[protein]-cysteine S-methyltransferase [Shewanella sp. Isolate11]MCG9698331.1 methylated-DNA--[protein]-cysteine S-methyltransferase [Shewanella sp. Isolate11]